MFNNEFESIEALTKAFPNEQACIMHLEKLRWPQNVTSPFDPISTVYRCNNGQYRCRNTGKYFNVKTGTIFYNTKIPLQKWFMAIFIISHARTRITSVALANELDLTQKSAWFIMRRINKQLGIEAGKFAKVDGGTISIEAPRETNKLQMSQWLELIKKQ